MSTLNIVKAGSGFLLEYGDMRLALDTGVDGEVTLLSHSHSDHIQGVNRASNVIATEGTFDTWAARGGRSPRHKTIIEHGETLSQLGVDITSLNAGHVLGSSMYHIKFGDGLTLLYTGDFNNVNSIVHSAAQPVHADVLVTEATYGTPRWIFPERSVTHQKIIDVARAARDLGRIVLFHAYSLGKAQEAIALLQDSGFDVISGNRSIDNVCEVYVKHGVKIQHRSMDDLDKTNLLEEGGIIVSASTHHTLTKLQRVLHVRSRGDIENHVDSYSLSGWTLGRYSVKGFPLSAHTDFQGLLDFAKGVQPRLAYCFTSNASVLSRHLKEQGIQAVPLE